MLFLLWICEGVGWADVCGLDFSEPDVAYAQSKLANVLFTKELAKRLAKEQIYAFTLHPGGSLPRPRPRLFIKPRS